MRVSSVGIIGLGYVGLPLGLNFAEAKIKVVGFDVDQTKVDAINAGRSYIEHIPSDRIAASSHRLSATNEPEKLSGVDAIIICVPTPLNKQREPDVSYIEKTLEIVGPHLTKGQLMSLESTTYPGTTSELIQPFLENLGFSIGKDFYLVYSPEREDPGNKHYNTHTIPKVIGGVTAACLKRGEETYSLAIKNLVPVSSPAAAEMTKLLENIHRSINIGLVNEMKIVAHHMGIDIFEVIKAAATKPFGFTPYYPGPGLGGHCIPIDPFYLTWKAREYDLNTRFIELSGEIDNDTRRWVVNQISIALNDHEKSVKNSKILFLGIAYKKNVDDARESPSIKLMEVIRDLGGLVSYSDPHLPKFPKMREHKFNLESVELKPEALEEFDCVVLTTDHDAFDYDVIKAHSKLIVDTRGKYAFDNSAVYRA